MSTYAPAVAAEAQHHLHETAHKSFAARTEIHPPPSSAEDLDPITPGRVPPYESSSLAAQWVGSSAAVAAVLVAVLFGYLTLASNRRSKDAQQRATLVAALDDPNRPQSILAQNEQVRADLSIRHKAGETWLLVNEGPDVVFVIDIEGMTDLDRRRLIEVASEPASLAAGDVREFVLVSRLTLSGPANVVVKYRLRPGGSVLSRVLQVPSS